MDKHAYCIIAHTDPHCLQTLVDLIDHERNDIFILSDRKSDASLYEDIHAERSYLEMLPQRIDIRWGDISQVEAELALFEKAVTHGEKYRFIHLLSGQDLPLHTPDHIHRYCADLPEGTNLIGFSEGKDIESNVRQKTKYYHILTRHYRHPNKWIRNTCSAIRHLCIMSQKALRISRKWEGKYTLAKGCNWVSISMDFARYLVSHKAEILKKFRFVQCADEMYKQTLIMSSPFRKTVYDRTGAYYGPMRMIDWKRGNPYIWRSEDFNVLINSEDLFARKFSSYVDIEVIDRLQNHLQ